jgi:ribonucleoside-triphosphate reductase
MTDMVQGLTHYDREVAEAHISGDLYIHDLHQGIKGRDAGWDISKILKDYPALQDFLSSILTSVQSFGKDWVGFQNLHGWEYSLRQYFDDITDQGEIIHVMKSFLRGINNSSMKVILTFNLEEENSHQLNLQKSLHEAFTREVYSFPILNYNITRSFPWEEDISRFPLELSSQYGYPYFTNHLGDHGEKRTEYPDPRKLYRLVDGFRGYAPSSGSIGKVTINLPRLSILTQDEDRFQDLVGDKIDLATEALERKRELLLKRIRDEDQPPNFENIEALDWFFSSIGIVGMNEALFNLIEGGITNPAGKAVTYKILEYIRDRLIEKQLDTGYPYNIEGSPEHVADIFFNLDKERYPDFIDLTDYRRYTPSTSLPLGYTNDLWQALEHQKGFQKLYTGTSHFDVTLEEGILYPEKTGLLIKRILKHFDIPSLAISPVFSICPIHGYISGESPLCPRGGESTTIYHRVEGVICPWAGIDEVYKEVVREREHYDVRSSR